MEREPANAKQKSSARGPADRAVAPPLLDPVLEARGNQSLQASLRISQPDDPSEREAERVAEAVAGDGMVQRMCTACTDEQESAVDRAAKGDGATEGGFRASALAGGGEPIPPAARVFFEDRFASDFGAVRIHRDGGAAAAARSIDARAFTVGRDIGFAEGEYAPDTAAGRKLLAHELTHVVQQRSGAAEVRREVKSAPGQKNTERVVTSSSPNSGQGVFEGEVVRSRTIQTPTGEQTDEMGLVRVRFDTRACKVTLPLKIAFDRADATNWSPCTKDDDTFPHRKAVSDAVFESARAAYLKELRTSLSGWYTVRLENCSQPTCEGKDIPIEAEVEEVAPNAKPDFLVLVARSNKRSCASYRRYGSGKPGTVNLYVTGEVGRSDRRTFRHEGDHMALGYGDEYAEEGRPAGRVVDDDFSRLGNIHAYGPWALLHERHFGFVPAFLEHVLGKGCKATLREVARPPDHGLQMSIDFGTIYSGGSFGATVGLGLELAESRNRLRTLELSGGLHGRMLAGAGPYREAYLAGLRLGMRSVRSPSGGGLRTSWFGELGAGRFTDAAGLGTTLPYAEVGGSFGYSFKPIGGNAVPFVSAEIGIGSTFGEAAQERMKWFRGGLYFGANFFGP